MKYSSLTSYRELTALCISIGNYFLYDTVTNIFINFKVVSETPAMWSVTGATNHSLVCHWLVWFVFPCCVPVVHIPTFTAEENSNNSTSCLISIFLGFAAEIGDILDQLGDE